MSLDMNHNKELEVSCKKEKGIYIIYHNKELEVSCKKVKGIYIIQVVGNVRFDTIEPLQKTWEEVCPSCNRLIFEITSKDFATAGITFLTEIASFLEKKKGAMAVVTDDKFHIDNFEICKLTPKHFKVFSSCEEAIEFLVS